MSSQGFARKTDPMMVQLRGAIRRMAISTTAKMLWRLTGFKLPAGVEKMDAEVFGGIGVYARPPASVSAEAITLMVGGATTPVVVATRDEATRAAVAGSIAADETAIYNSSAIMLIKANGTIELRSAAGVALPLATKADLDALRTWVSTHVHGGGGTPPVAPPPPTSIGTTKLRGE